MNIEIARNLLLIRSGYNATVPRGKSHLAASFALLVCYAMIIFYGMLVI
jgi:hypothetical protein